MKNGKCHCLNDVIYDQGIHFGLQVIASGQFGVATRHGRSLHHDTSQRNRGRGPFVARDRARIALSMGKRLHHSGVSSRYANVDFSMI